MYIYTTIIVFSQTDVRSIMTTLQNIWINFSTQQICSALNSPGSITGIQDAEKKLGFLLPTELTELLVLNNGQIFNREGVFKNITGWNVYNKLKFLDVQSVVWAYKEILNDTDLVSTFGISLIPFATEGGNAFLGDTYTINKCTNEIFTLRTTAVDWTLPKDWQLSAFKRADNLVDFLKLQVMLYN